MQRNAAFALALVPFVTAFGLHSNGTRCMSGVTPTPNVGFGNNELLSASGTGPTDVWAVGYYMHDGLHQPLIEHFDGHAWSVVLAPTNPHHPDDALYSVSALNATDAWAVGVMGPHCGGCAAMRPFSLHWNGSAWKEVLIPRASTDPQYLISISVNPSIGADVWAVGNIPPPGLIRGEPSLSYAENWNGVQWSFSDLPGGGYHGQLVFDVSTAPDGEAWLVGQGLGRENQWSIAHFDGTSWTSQDSVGTHDHLFSVRAIAGNDVWAVGDRIEHYDGITWQESPSPRRPGPLLAVSALNTSDVWASGVDGSIFHWDGVKWYAIPPVVPAALTGVQAFSNGAIAVGWAYDPRGRTRTESVQISCSDAP